jgi:hypothetical protein
VSARWAIGLLLGAACSSHPNLRTIDSLSESTLQAASYHGADLSTVSILLSFAQGGVALGDGCPVVIATGTVNGAPLEQLTTGGPMACDDPPYCESEGICLLPSWRGEFPSGFPPSSDGMLTIVLADAGAPATMVSGLDLWATATVSDVTAPSDPGGAPLATLTIVPSPPYPQVDVAQTTNPYEPLFQTILRTSSAEFFVPATDTGVSNRFQLTFPTIQDLPRPATGELDINLYFSELPSIPRTTVCTGVQTCTAQDTDALVPVAVTLPL